MIVPSALMLRLVLVAILGGLAFRLLPLMLGMPALAEMFLTEDGYLMLTVARNMAIGLGMSVSEGTIATNGVQPLATFLFTIPYLATGGDRVAGLVGVHLVLIAATLGALFAVRAFAARILRGMNLSDVVLWSWIVAALWFLGPVLLRHSMNGLETGLITLMTVAVMLQFGRVIEKGPEATLMDRLMLGLICGIAFLARIDAAILCVAVFAVWALDLLIRQRLSVGTVFVRLLVPGLACLAVAAPWLLNNLLGFGSIMPVSGPAQSLDATPGAHAPLIASKTFELFFPMLPVPNSLEWRPVAVALFAGCGATIFSIFLFRVIRSGHPVVRMVILAYVLHATAIIAYYGIFFGAPHFLSRYLAPLAPLLILASVVAALEIGRWLMPKRQDLLATAYGLGGLIVSGALLIRLLLPGAPDQGHEQVIAWVEENVPEEAWVGAIQTGTLGYWHDRTINLDGKVNPDALAARIAEGHVLNYVTASEIDYLADWAGLGHWIDLPAANDGFAEAFELILDDPDENLAVLRRIDPRHED